MSNQITRKEFDRRMFLKTGAAAGAAGALAATGAAQVLAEDRPAGLAAVDVSEKWAFEIAPDPIVDDQISDIVEADIIVIGSGTSGLVAANSAIDEGADVVLISASSIPISRGGSNNAVYSKVMERAGLPRQSIKDYREEMLANYNFIDQRKWYKYYNNSEEAMDYVIDIAEGAGIYVGLEQTNLIKEDSVFFQPYGTHCFLESQDTPLAGMQQQVLVDELARLFQAKGGRLDYRTCARQLVRGGVPNGTEGRVDAVIAEKLDDGAFVKYVGVKAIIMATGDFSADQDMMTKYCPTFVHLVPQRTFETEVDYDNNKLATGGVYRGDGQKMGLWVGAAWQKSGTAVPMYGPRTAGPAYHRCANYFGLLVDRNGRRFMDEYEGRSLGPINQSIQAGGKSYAIWDIDTADRFTWYDQSYVYQIRDDTIRDVESIKSGWDATVERGGYLRADTLEELVELAGLPASTLDEIARYNEMCDAGSDTDFYKDPEFLIPVKNPPFYCQVADYTAGELHTVLGGLRTNSEMQVCDADDNPIPGLYNVGAMIGDLYAGMYTFKFAGLNYGMACITFGYLTGKYVARNE